MVYPKNEESNAKAINENGTLFGRKAKPLFKPLKVWLPKGGSSDENTHVEREKFRSKLGSGG